MNINLKIQKKVNTRALRKTISIFALAFLFVGVSANGLSEIDKINQEINSLNQTITENNSKKQTVQNELSSIDAQTEVIRLQISSTQMQLDAANQQVETLRADVAKAEADLLKQKTVLGEYVRQMYIQGQVSQVELVLTSNNFSDFVDKSQYLSTMQEKVTNTIAKIQILKKELEDKKHEAEIKKDEISSLMGNQVAQKNALEGQQAYRNAVISDLDSSNSSLASQKDALYKKKAKLSIIFGENIINGSTGYPWGNPVPSSLSCNGDGCALDGLGYYIGQCTSYVAWKRLQIGAPIPPAIGNGGEWRGSAAGYSQSYIPQSGDVMVFPNLGYYGHVAFVESVNNNGTVYISEYNWVQDSYTERIVNPASYGAYFIHTN